MPSPVVALNRAIAHGMAFGAAAGLRLLREIEGQGALAGYAPLPAAIGDALFRLGRRDEARAAFMAAAGLTGNARERDFLRRRAVDCGNPP
jgi:predicted RNA polymerase sigma factor